MLRSLSLQLQGEPETQLPLTRPEDLIKTDDVLDLSKTRTQKQRHIVFRTKPAFGLQDSSHVNLFFVIFTLRDKPWIR